MRERVQREILRHAGELGGRFALAVKRAVSDGPCAPVGAIRRELCAAGYSIEEIAARHTVAVRIAARQAIVAYGQSGDRDDALLQAVRGYFDEIVKGRRQIDSEWMG